MPKNSPSQAVCSYCKGKCEVSAVKCQNCGAPLLDEEVMCFDARSCPYCQRKLLALASPSCSYCGLRLPEHFIKKREEHLHRIAAMNEASKNLESKNKIDEVLKIAVRHDRKGKDSMLELINWVELTDLFS
ncbi:MAG: hypothetical protein HY231_02825 [Acidobacteria bacterium]|nr:hypothetical protein [Acidobacteriota bacterium]